MMTFIQALLFSKTQRGSTYSDFSARDDNCFIYFLKSIKISVIMNAPKKPNPQARGQLTMSRKRLFPSYKEMEAEKLFS